MRVVKPSIRQLFAALLATALASVAAVAGSATMASAQEVARIHLIHGIPDTDVDVVAAGEVVFADFSFGDTQDLSALAGETLEGLEVRLAGTDTVAIEGGDLALPATGNVTALAHLDADGAPTLTVFANDTSTIAAGEGRLVVRHTAAAPSVDILADGAVAFADVTNGAEGAIDLPVATVSASVVPTGETAPVVIGPADLPITDGDALIVYAVGSLEGGSLTVLTETINDLGSTPTIVNTGNSPVGSAPSATSAFAVIALLSVIAVGLGLRANARSTVAPATVRV